MIEKYVWSDIKKQVREWAKACIRCQKCKVSRHTKSKLGEFEQPDERFSVVHIDLIGKLPPSEGMQYCLTCIDRFSCWMEAIPIPEITAEIVGRAFYEKWICRFGVPAKIVTDQGRQFEAELFRSIAAICGAKVAHTTSYHPQCNGKVERLHRTLKGAIKAHNNIRWTESLPTVLLGLRAAIRPDISYTIAQMVYGTSIKLPGEFFDPPTINMDPQNFVAKLQQHMAELKPLKSPSNRKQNIFVHKDLKSCSHVFLRIDRVKKALEPPYEGPYTVQKNETEFKIEFNIIEEYREKALRIELKSKRVLENIKSKQNNNEGSNSGNNSHLADCENPYKAITPRLPEVELYKFGEEKIAIIKRKGLCRICLAKGHLASRCRSQITCQLCSKRHIKFMYPNIECNKSDSLKQDVNDKNINENTVDSLHSRATNEVILQTLVVNVHGIKRERKARAIIDTGSQKSYILRSAAEEFGFNLQREEEFRHSLFGGTKTRMYKHKCYKIYLSSLDGNYICKLDALDHDIFKKTQVPLRYFLGADVAGKLITGRREELKTGLVALETKLGWTLMGKVPRYTDKKDTSMNIVTMLSQEDIPVSSLWDLEMLGIRDTIEQNSREEKEKAVMPHFLETVRQKEDGRYEIHMPWKVDRVFLTDNYELCLKRLESTTRKLEKIGFREKYHEVFREWLAEGVIEEIPGKELPVRTHYLPHRPVIKETSATSSMKIRPVFDASSKINNHPSLNDCLETGNNLIESVPAILARFRLKPIGVISDIRRAFLQISLHEKDRDFVRFLWYDNEGNIRTYRHARVAFGVTSSPFLLMAVINYHLLKESQQKNVTLKNFLKNYKIVFMSIIT
ncbi:hypothetical protein TNCV_717511 [Trichonephila clavipes]|nr:hypothetical protein TNCV_717511 [Trichonephila clavipes]